jgi:hypothetical protein
MRAAQRRRAVFVVILGFAAVAMAGLILFVSFTADLIPNNRFNADNYVQYGLQQVKITANDENTATGLPAKTITFKFGDSGESYGKDALDSGGLEILGENVEKEIDRSPAIYNIEGSGTKETNLNFNFRSVSPSDYKDRTYLNAYSAFTRIGESTNVASLSYDSAVDEQTGRRIVNVVEKGTSITGDDVLGNNWQNLLEALPTDSNTTYNVTFDTGENLTVNGTFSTKQERNALMNVDSTVWKNAAGYVGISGYDSSSVYNVKKADLYLSPVKDSNQTTLALTISKGIDKGTFLNSFQTRAAEDPDLSYVSAMTTTLTVDGEKTPFNIIYPSNRDW